MTRKTEHGFFVLFRLPRFIWAGFGWLIVIGLIMLFMHNTKESIAFDGHRSVDGLTLDDSSVQLNRNEGEHGTITGVITNTSGHALENITVEYNLFDAQGNEIEKEEARYSDESTKPLPAGATWKFKVHIEPIGDFDNALSKLDHISFSNMSADDVSALPQQAIVAVQTPTPVPSIPAEAPVNSSAPSVRPSRHQQTKRQVKRKPIDYPTAYNNLAQSIENTHGDGWYVARYSPYYAKVVDITANGESKSAEDENRVANRLYLDFKYLRVEYGLPVDSPNFWILFNTDNLVIKVDADGTYDLTPP